MSDEKLPHEEHKARTADSNDDDSLRPSNTGLNFSDAEEIGAWTWKFSRISRLHTGGQRYDGGRFTKMKHYVYMKWVVMIREFCDPC
jgi:hypothetical protein